MTTLTETQARLADINRKNMPMTPLDELAAKVSDLVAQVRAEQATTLDAARKALNEAGIGAARKRLVDYLNDLPKAQETVRAAQEQVRQAKVQLDQALAEAEWELDSKFVQEGNKTYLVLGPDAERKPMTADERKEWKKLEARNTEGVQKAEAIYQDAEAGLNTARDLLAWHDKAFSAAKADLSASVASLEALSKGISQ